MWYVRKNLNFYFNDENGDVSFWQQLSKVLSLSNLAPIVSYLISILSWRGKKGS